VYSFLIAVVLALVIKSAGLLRAGTEAEVEGIDYAEHAEAGYDLSITSGSSGGGAFAMAGIAPGGTPASAAPPPAEAPVAEQVTS
jgi:Amt family ammonium transporter